MHKNQNQNMDGADPARLTHEDLRKWGAALDQEMPRGLGERLMRFADDWRAALLVDPSADM